VRSDDREFVGVVGCAEFPKANDGFGEFVGFVVGDELRREFGVPRDGVGVGLAWSCARRAERSLMGSEVATYLSRGWRVSGQKY
jgi:hypothetical protein